MVAGVGCWSHVGSPPRVRSRRRPQTCRRPARGITSACAEQTLRTVWTLRCHRDHLRVCGADRGVVMALAYRLGSPPRVRSRPADPDDAGISVGITSACAEQTTTTTLWAEPPGDHLRVCGVDHLPSDAVRIAAGSPPRVRSRHHYRCVPCVRVGITSACAEQTPSSGRRSIRNWDHLRVCGADAMRKRRRFRRQWITSACAEQTRRSRSASPAYRDHLRVCGADHWVGGGRRCLRGSPPRVRSRLLRPRRG